MVWKTKLQGELGRALARPLGPGARFLTWREVKALRLLPAARARGLGAVYGNKSPS